MVRKYDDILHNVIIEVVIRDTPITRERTAEDLKLHAKREELAKQKNMAKTTKDYTKVSCLIYISKSDAYIKDDPKNVH